MNNLFRGLIAGWGAKKLGGGCLSTILIFALIWWALGTCYLSIIKIIGTALACLTDSVLICESVASHILFF